MKTKLNLSKETIGGIEKEYGVKIVEEKDAYFEQFHVGDFVINKHGEAGFIRPTYEWSDIRVHVGNHIVDSITGSNGYETLEINGFHVFIVIKDENIS